MSEVVALQFLQLLIVAFPPFAMLLARYLPDNDEEPLVQKVRAILPLEGQSTKAVREIERRRFLDDPAIFTTPPPEPTDTTNSPDDKE